MNVMTKKLYIRNLSFNADELQLEAFFKNAGLNVVSVKIPRERETGRSRGFGFVELATGDEALQAINTLNGRDFMGRPLKIDEAREQAPRTGGFGARSGGPREGTSRGFGAGGGRNGGFDRGAGSSMGAEFGRDAGHGFDDGRRRERRDRNDKRDREKHRRGED